MRKLIIEEKQFNMLFELNNNLKFREVDRDIRELGFTRRNGVNCYVYKNKDGVTITIHAHGDNSQAKADTFKHVVEGLSKYGWFKDANNVKRIIPTLKKWGFTAREIQNIISGVDTTEDDIKAANEEYADATVQRVFDIPNSVCVLDTSNGINLCRSSEDRRPLLDNWYTEFGYPRNGRNIPCLKYDNTEDEDNWRTECYPINKDGTLDYENVIIESKKYGKRRIW